MTKHRGILVALVLIAMAAASALVAIEFAYRLPSPESASGQDLMRWLVTRDLRNETDQTRLKLLHRLEQQLDSLNHQANGGSEKLDSAQQKLFQLNIDLLVKLWSEEKSHRYRQLSKTQRRDFLDRQLATISSVEKILGRISNGPSNEGFNSGRLHPLIRLVKKIEAQSKHALEDQRATIHQFLLALQVRWLETYDLSNVSHGVKLQIVHEMEERLRTGLRFNLDKDDLDELYPDQFWKNFDLLAEVMLLERVDRYFALPESQRIEYLSAQVDDFVSWPIVAREMSVEPIDDPDSAQGLGSLTRLFNKLSRYARKMALVDQKIESWIQHADPEKRQRVRQFVLAARDILLVRLLQDS